MALFDVKNFNPEVFGNYVESIPNVNLNELYNSRALKTDPRLNGLFSDQTGAVKGTLPFFGRLEGEPDNYDGQTDINSTSLDTYTQQFICIGRGKGFKEKDFSTDVTGGVPFMDTVGAGIADYWGNVYQDELLAVLKGVFSMTGTGNIDFVNGHTTDISEEEDSGFGVTTLNSALQKASGDAKSSFSIAIMHSKVATDLENLQLLQYLKYTDASGIQRDLTLATLNGRTVLIDDSMPVETDETGAKYTTYVLGNGAITFQDVGAAVPYEMGRDAAKNGGETTLFSRRRFVIAPDGLSFVGNTTHSPTRIMIESGANWGLVTNNQTGAKKFYPHKKIAIARIITK